MYLLFIEQSKNYPLCTYVQTLHSVIAHFSKNKKNLTHITLIYSLLDSQKISLYAPMYLHTLHSEIAPFSKTKKIYIHYIIMYAHTLHSVIPYKSKKILTHIMKH
jgi:hypothetical protein